MTLSFCEAISKYQDSLKEVTSISRREIEVLIEFIEKKDRLYFIKNPKEQLGEDCEKKLKSFINKRKKGFPLEYIIRQKEFFGLNFFVNDDVLIPRPETEILVEETIKFLKNKNDVSILDLGTGSGCIAISIAKILKDKGKRFKLIAVDKSLKAIKIARRNANDNNVKSKILFRESEWFSNINEKFDVIVSNPPYVANTLKKDFPNLQYEPDIALFSGDDGLSDINYLLETAPNFLNDNGLFLFEFGIDQEESIIKKAKSIKAYKETKIINDLANIPRVFKGIV